MVMSESGTSNLSEGGLGDLNASLLYEQIIPEEIRRLFLHNLQDYESNTSHLSIGAGRSSQLDEVTQGPSVGGHEDHRLGGVGEDGAGSLSGLLLGEAWIVTYQGRNGALVIRQVAPHGLSPSLLCLI